MSTNRSCRISRRAAERLLRSRPVTGPDRLSNLLAAASAPAHERELVGESAAIAAFRSARIKTATQQRRRSMLKIGLAKLLTAKAAAVAVVAVGGIAVAAAAGGLPGQHGNEPGQGNEVVKTSSAPHSEKPATKEKGNGDNPSPSPNLKGQCEAYTAGAGSEHGKRRDNPAFAALVEAAGGEDKIPAFCTDLLDDKPGKSEEHKDNKPHR